MLVLPELDAPLRMMTVPCKCCVPTNRRLVRSHVVHDGSDHRVGLHIEEHLVLGSLKPEDALIRRLRRNPTSTPRR